jgi:hypothetical protein
MRHSLTVADIALAFRRAAAGNPDHEVIAWEADWQAAQRLGPGLVVPDARLVYVTKEHELVAFVEVDLGSEGSRFFARKVGRYLDLYRSGSWRMHMRQWPLILVITPSARRADELRRATEALLSTEPDERKLWVQTEFGFTCLTDLTTVGPLAAVWQVAGRQGRQTLLPDVHQDQVRVD